MKVLVIGQGGREHAICHTLERSPSVSKVYCAPGNPGIAEVAELVPLKETDISSLIQFAKDQEIELTVVGPEAPLLAGIVNRFQEENLTIFGPTKEAAIIEGSKSFTKDLMKKYSIPTAQYDVFTDLEAAKEYVNQIGAPIVVKADGLAAGKGVVVALSLEEAHQALEDMLVHSKFGEASAKVVIEEYLEGEEFSLMAFVNGTDVYPMVIAQDHKRAFDGDQGPNTGGMGAYSTVPFISQADIDTAVDTILEPTAKAMVEEGRSFTGVLYAGLMLTKDGPKVIEFNARFGDPETQVVLPRLQSDLGHTILNILQGNKTTLQWDEHFIVGVVIAAEGYPEEYKKGMILPKEDLARLSTGENVYVFHAGTAVDDNQQLVSNGGRVFLMAAKATDLEAAQARIYAELEKLNLEGFFYRRDIGARAISHSASLISE